MRILVTGSRDWDDAEAIDIALTEATRGISYHKVTIVTGYCRTGADEIARLWAAEREVDFQGYPAQWQRYGQAAGPIRNIQMCESGIDICLAFLMPCRIHTDGVNYALPHYSHGATQCADYAESKGINVKRFVA